MNAPVQTLRLESQWFPRGEKAANQDVRVAVAFMRENHYDVFLSLSGRNNDDIIKARDIEAAFAVARAWVVTGAVLAQEPQP